MESSTGTAVNVCPRDGFTKFVDTLAYYIDSEKEEMNILCSYLLFDRNVIDSGMMCSFLKFVSGSGEEVMTHNKATRRCTLRKGELHDLW